MTAIFLGGAFFLGLTLGPSLGLGVVLTVMVALARRWRVGSVGLVGALVFAALIGAWRGEPRPDFEAPAWIGEARQFRVNVASDPTFDGERRSFRAEVVGVRSGAEWEARSGCLMVSAPAYPEVRAGDRVWLTGFGRGIDEVPEGVAEWLRSRECAATIYASDVSVDENGSGLRRTIGAWREGVSATLYRAAGGDVGALMSGLVTGDDFRLSDRRRDAFVRTGTTHITAVSGANIALIVGTLGAVTRQSRRPRRVRWQLAFIALIWGYACFVGFNPPVVRAALVATFGLLAARWGRRPDFVTLTVLAGVAMVAFEPGLVWSLSFQLSFAASLAITAVMQISAPAEEPAVLLRQSFAAMVAAQLASFPVLLLTGPGVGLLSLPANLAIGPLVIVAFPIVGLAAMVGWLWPDGGAAIAASAALLIRALVWTVDRFASLSADLGQFDGQTDRVVAGVVLTSIVALTLMSEDGRRWAERTWRALPNAPGEIRALLWGGLAGLLVMFVLT
jgi:ComEC/Rec2-related protein